MRMICICCMCKVRVSVISICMIITVLYSFEQYKSIDVYKAVLETNVKNVDEFLLLFKASNSSLSR